jgi:hypothetical protein
MSQGRVLVSGAAVAAFFMLALIPSASAYREYWGCFQRAPDGQCVVTVSIGNSFAAVDQQVIREVLADFSQSANIEAVEAGGGNGDVSIVQGCYKGTCGFYTDIHHRKVYIDPAWSYATYCCDSHDGMRGVYCHELMHAIAGEGDGAVRLEPSCFNGTSPFLGPEDFAVIAAAYPLP